MNSGFDCTEEENVTSLSALRKRAWLVLRSKIDERTSDTAFLANLRNHFEERFRYDENGVPRVWRPEDDIDGAFKKAKDQVCNKTWRTHDPLLISISTDYGADTAIFEN